MNILFRLCFLNIITVPFKRNKNSNLNFTTILLFLLMANVNELNYFFQNLYIEVLTLRIRPSEIASL